MFCWKVVSKSKGVTGDVEAMLMAALRNVLASEGVSEIAMSKSMAVSGDMKMTVTYKQAQKSHPTAGHKIYPNHHK